MAKVSRARMILRSTIQKALPEETWVEGVINPKKKGKKRGGNQSLRVKITSGSFCSEDGNKVGPKSEGKDDFYSREQFLVCL